MSWKILVTIGFFVLEASSSPLIASGEVKSLKRVLPKDVAVLSSVDPQSRRFSLPAHSNRQNEQTIHTISPEVFESPQKRRAPQHDKDAYKENSSGSTTDGSPHMGADFLLSDAACRRKIYGALQKNEHDIVKALLMIMALNSLAEPELLSASHRTMSQLLPRFKTILNESLPIFSSYTYVDILCSLPQWHEALMIVFFDELKSGILRSRPQVLRARYYAVKWLESRLKKLLKEFLLIMASENPSLLTPTVQTFLNPEFVPQTFEHFLYDQITEKLQSYRSISVSSSDIFERTTPPLNIFEQLELIENDGL